MGKTPKNDIPRYLIKTDPRVWTTDHCTDDRHESKNHRFRLEGAQNGCIRKNALVWTNLGINIRKQS